MIHIFPDSKRGVSAVLETVIFIALAIAVVGIIWAVVNGIVQKNINETEACFGIFDKVTLNQRYTCYNETSRELRFSVEVKDVEVDDILVSVVSQGNSAEFRINNNSQVSYANGTNPAFVPGENKGRLYKYAVPSSFLFGIDRIVIVPVINDKVCEAPSVMDGVDSCSLVIG